MSAYSYIERHYYFQSGCFNLNNPVTSVLCIFHRWYCRDESVTYCSVACVLCDVVGKTAAFMVPTLERLMYCERSQPVTRVLVLAPTRELAIQIYEESRKLAQFTSITICLSAGKLLLPWWSCLVMFCKLLKLNIRLGMLTTKNTCIFK